MLVERLVSKGLRVEGVDLNPNMVAFARRRRGIELVEADAADLPFADGSYKTSIIATGVIDFLEDDAAILSVTEEVTRVTDTSGQTLAAFFQFHPTVERLFRRSGLITDGNFVRFRRMNEMGKLSCENPIGYLRAFKRDANLSYGGTIMTLLKALLSLPREEKRVRKRFAKLWQQAKRELDNPDLLLECGPELVPYRTEEDIRELFKRLAVPIQKTLAFDSCVVAQLGRCTLQQHG